MNSETEEEEKNEYDKIELRQIKPTRGKKTYSHTSKVGKHTSFGVVKLKVFSLTQFINYTIVKRDRMKSAYFLDETYKHISTKKRREEQRRRQKNEKRKRKRERIKNS